MTQDEIIKAKERLIRIMGTFDLATGHADTFDQLLDSLESELRDVLGYYREALKENIGCAECGVNGNHALYCVACAEKFLLSEAIKHEREECASLNIPITAPERDYLDMSPLEIYEEALMDATLSFRATIRARGQA
jgi:hypothetical protein